MSDDDDMTRICRCSTRLLRLRGWPLQQFTATVDVRRQRSPEISDTTKCKHYN